MSTKSHVHTWCGTLRKSSISTRGYVAIHIWRPIFDHKNSIWKNLGLKIQTVETCSSANSTCWKFYIWKTLKSRFWIVFQSFGIEQILAVLANFGQILANLLDWLWLTSCPKITWNLKNLIIFELFMSPNFVCSVSLKSYHPYLEYL